MILDETVLEKFPPKPSAAVFFDCFPHNFRPEVGNDVISGTALDNVGVDVYLKFGDSRSNVFRDIR